MKRLFILVFFLVSFSIFTNAQINTWTGGASGNWSTNASWSLGHFPTSVEDVIISTTTDINVDVFVSSVNNINSLRITGGVSVTLSCAVAGTRYLRPFSTSAVTIGLSIEAGNTLTFDATNTSGTGNWVCDLTGNNGVTAIIDGTLQFAGTGSSAGGARLDVFSGALAYAALAVSGTGKILYLTDTGNTNSAAGTYLTMQAGSIFEIQKNGGSFPNASWNATSIAKATNTGANPPSFLGTIYGNLEINLTGITTPLFFNANISFNDINLISTGADVIRVKTGTGATTYTLTINGDLTVSAASTLETSGNTTTSGNPGIISVKGNIINNGIIRENAGVAVTGNQFQLTGTSNQNISGSGTWTGNDFTFVMNNASGATLLSPLSLPYNLELTSGKITTTAVNLLTMVDNATYTGGSTTSFVNGPMKKIGDDNFSFPIGTGSIYAPIGIANVSGETIADEFTAEYIRSNPQAVHGTMVQSGQDHVSLVEYWTLSHSGAATKQISLAINYTSFCFDLSKTYVSRWDGAGPFWTNQGSTFVSGPSAPPLVSGTITSTTSVSSYGDFTLITDLAPILNPLPVKLVDFTATKINSSTSSVTWELAACCSGTAKFELEKSTDGRNYFTIITVPGSETNRFYSVQDNGLNNGITYYRLRIKDADGKSIRSRIVAVINNTDGLLITSLWPNPVQSNASFTITAARAGKVMLSIYDLSGKQISEWQAAVTGGNNTIQLFTDRLAKGTYHIIAKNGTARSVLRFIKH